MNDQIEFEITSTPFTVTEKIIMQAQETQEEFIFKTISNWYMFETEHRLGKQELIDALSKQKPAKPIYRDEHHAYCLKCDKRLSMKRKPKYCMRCGQKVLWHD